MSNKKLFSFFSISCFALFAGGLLLATLFSEPSEGKAVQPFNIFEDMAIVTFYYWGWLYFLCFALSGLFLYMAAREVIGARYDAVELHDLWGLSDNFNFLRILPGLVVTGLFFFAALVTEEASFFLSVENGWLVAAFFAVAAVSFFIGYYLPYRAVADEVDILAGVGTAIMERVEVLWHAILAWFPAVRQQSQERYTGMKAKGFNQVANKPFTRLLPVACRQTMNMGHSYLTLRDIQRMMTNQEQNLAGLTLQDARHVLNGSGKKKEKAEMLFQRRPHAIAALIVLGSAKEHAGVGHIPGVPTARQLDQLIGFLGPEWPVNRQDIPLPKPELSFCDTKVDKTAKAAKKPKFTFELKRWVRWLIWGGITLWALSYLPEAIEAVQTMTWWEILAWVVFIIALVLLLWWLLKKLLGILANKALRQQITDEDLNRRGLHDYLQAIRMGKGYMDGKRKEHEHVKYVRRGLRPDEHNKSYQKQLDELLSDQEPQPQGNIGSYGGECLDLETAKKEAQSMPPSLFKALCRNLVALFHHLENNPLGTVESPRVDDKKLAKKLLSYQFDFSNVNKEEMANRPMIVLGVDISGSCSAVANIMGAVFYRVQEELPNVVLVFHSNGLPLSFFGKKAAQLPELNHYTDTLAWWQDVVQNLGHVAGFVNVGDSDALPTMRHMANMGLPPVWLDHGMTYWRKQNNRRPSFEWRTIHNALDVRFYATGVHDPETVNKALQLAVENIKKDYTQN